MTTAPNRPFKAIVFDLDGTMIDSAPDLRTALNHLLAEHGRPPLELAQVIQMIGDGVRTLVERGFAATGPAAPDRDLDGLTERYLGFYEGHAADLSRPFPGVLAALAHFHEQGLALGVCTNKPHAATMEILKTFGMDGYFQAVVGGDSLDGIRKPDPRHLLAVLKGLGVTVDETVMVGDNEHDMAVARAAGVPVVAVSYGYAKGPPAELEADGLITHFDELSEALKRLS